MKFLDAEWFEEHKRLLEKEFSKPNRNSTGLVEVYENCYGEEKTIWIQYQLENGLPKIMNRGEGDDNIPESQFRCFGDYDDYVLVLQGKLDPNKGIMTGKFTLEGNLMKAMGMLGTYKTVTKCKNVPNMNF